MGRIDIMGWPFRSPNWVQTFLVIGLIGLIPILGGINTYGWMMTAVDNFRAGRSDLPPAGFYLERGWRLYVVHFVYAAVPAGILVLLFLIVGLGIGGAAASGSSASSATAGVLTFLLFALYGLLLLVALLIPCLLPVLAVATDLYGIAGALNPMLVVGWIQVRTGPVLIAMLLGFAAQFVGQVGVYACFVGIILTVPLAYAMLSGVIRNLELDLAEARS